MANLFDVHRTTKLLQQIMREQIDIRPLMPDLQQIMREQIHIRPLMPDLQQIIREQIHIRPLMPDLQQIIREQIDIRPLMPDLQQIMREQIDIRPLMPDLQQIIREQIDFSSYMRELLQEQVTATEGPEPAQPEDDLSIDAFMLHILDKLESLDARIDLMMSKVDEGTRLAIKQFMAALILALLLAAINLAIQYGRLLPPPTR